jgi:hypothetical protein
MKKKRILKYSAVALFLGGIFLVSCNKEQTGEENTFQKSSINYGSIHVESGILCFENVQEIKNTLEFLESEYLARENNFIQSNEDLSEDELMAREAEIGYNEYEVFEEFENTLGFSSLRKKLHDEEVAWLQDADELYIENDPDNHFVLENEVRTILNEYCELKINDQFYKFFHGGHIIITDGDITKLELLRENIENALDMDNVIIEGDLSQARVDACNSMQFLSGFKVVGSRRIKWAISHQTWPWDRYVLSKTINYKKTGNNWNRFRTHTQCRVWGDISDWRWVYTSDDTTQVADCETPIQFNAETGVYSSRYGVKEWDHKIHVQTKTKSGWVKGWHYGYHSPAIEHNSTLTW